MSRCGTISAYVDGCHCAQCRQASTARARERRRLARLNDPRCVLPCHFCDGQWFANEKGRARHEAHRHAKPAT